VFLCLYNGILLLINYKQILVDDALSSKRGFTWLLFLAIDLFLLVITIDYLDFSFEFDLDLL